MTPFKDNNNSLDRSTNYLDLDEESWYFIRSLFDDDRDPLHLFDGDQDSLNRGPTNNDVNYAKVQIESTAVITSNSPTHAVIASDQILSSEGNANKQDYAAAETGRSNSGGAHSPEEDGSKSSLDSFEQSLWLAPFNSSFDSVAGGDTIATQFTNNKSSLNHVDLVEAGHIGNPPALASSCIAVNLEPLHGTSEALKSVETSMFAKFKTTTMHQGLFKGEATVSAMVYSLIKKDIRGELLEDGNSLGFIWFRPSVIKAMATLVKNKSSLHLTLVEGKDLQQLLQLMANLKGVYTGLMAIMTNPSDALFNAMEKDIVSDINMDIAGNIANNVELQSLLDIKEIAIAVALFSDVLGEWELIKWTTPTFSMDTIQFIVKVLKGLQLQNELIKFRSALKNFVSNEESPENFYKAFLDFKANASFLGVTVESTVPASATDSELNRQLQPLTQYLHLRSNELIPPTCSFTDSSTGFSISHSWCDAADLTLRIMGEADRQRLNRPLFSQLSELRRASVVLEGRNRLAVLQSITLLTLITADRVPDPMDRVQDAAIPSPNIEDLLRRHVLEGQMTKPASPFSTSMGLFNTVVKQAGTTRRSRSDNNNLGRVAGALGYSDKILLPAIKKASSLLTKSEPISHLARLPITTMDLPVVVTCVLATKPHRQLSELTNVWMDISKTSKAFQSEDPVLLQRYDTIASIFAVLFSPHSQSILPFHASLNRVLQYHAWPTLGRNESIPVYPLNTVNLRRLEDAVLNQVVETSLLMHTAYPPAAVGDLEIGDDNLDLMYKLENMDKVDECRRFLAKHLVGMKMSELSRRTLHFASQMQQNEQEAISQEREDQAHSNPGVDETAVGVDRLQELLNDVSNDTAGVTSGSVTMDIQVNDVKSGLRSLANDTRTKEANPRHSEEELQGMQNYVGPMQGRQASKHHHIPYDDESGDEESIHHTKVNNEGSVNDQEDEFNGGGSQARHTGTGDSSDEDEKRGSDDRHNDHCSSKSSDSVPDLVTISSESSGSSSYISRGSQNIPRGPQGEDSDSESSSSSSSSKERLHMFGHEDSENESESESEKRVGTKRPMSETKEGTGTSSLSSDEASMFRRVYVDKQTGQSTYVETRNLKPAATSRQTTKRGKMVHPNEGLNPEGRRLQQLPRQPASIGIGIMGRYNVLYADDARRVTGAEISLIPETRALKPFIQGKKVAVINMYRYSDQPCRFGESFVGIPLKTFVIEMKEGKRSWREATGEAVRLLLHDRSRLVHIFSMKPSDLFDQGSFNESLCDRVVEREGCKRYEVHDFNEEVPAWCTPDRHFDNESQKQTEAVLKLFSKRIIVDHHRKQSITGETGSIKAKGRAVVTILSKHPTENLTKNDYEKIVRDSLDCLREQVFMVTATGNPYQHRDRVPEYGFHVTEDDASYIASWESLFFALPRGPQGWQRRSRRTLTPVNKNLVPYLVEVFTEEGQWTGIAFINPNEESGLFQEFSIGDRLIYKQRGNFSVVTDDKITRYFFSEEIPFRVPNSTRIEDRNGNTIISLSPPDFFMPRDESPGAQLNEAQAQYKYLLEGDLVNNPLYRRTQNKELALQRKLYSIESKVALFTKWLQHHTERGLIIPSRQLQFYKLSEGCFWVSNSLQYAEQPLNNTISNEDMMIPTCFELTSRHVIPIEHNDQESTMSAKISDLWRHINEETRRCFEELGWGIDDDESTEDSQESNDQQSGVVEEEEEEN